MPVDYKKYVGWWKQFSEYIRFERAENKCEVCRIENYSTTERGTKVCLTVAHLDNGEDVCKCKWIHGIKCAIPDHVLAMCNACHLRYDAAAHAAQRRENRLNRKDKERLLFQ